MNTNNNIPEQLMTELRTEAHKQADSRHRRGSQHWFIYAEAYIQGAKEQYKKQGLIRDSKK